MSDEGREAVCERFEATWATPPGFSGWIATVNNNDLGRRYMLTALAFFVVGIVLALVMRTQLAVPDNTLVGPEAYNGLFTMHGSTMLYLFAVPFIEGLGVYFIPLWVGSRDLAFPRLTNFGYWLYLFGGIIMYSSVLFGAVPDAGWTAYPPLSGPAHSGIGLDFWLLGLSLLEIAGIGAALEIVVTILKLRAPGMSVRHIPVIAWTYLVAGLMIIVAFTPLLIATLLLEMDRSVGTHFFNPAMGGSSLLWQHLFWWFGHPEVYIIFLPATGIISTIIPAIAGRRLVAYPLVIAAIAITGFVSFGLWSHHMFTTGIPVLPMHFFTAASFMIALAAGIQIFAWIATIWGSRPRLSSVQMLFVLGFFFVFVNGGLTGVMVATMSFDWQVHETNFVVAHFHHVLIGGAVFPFLAGLYHWLPKISGRMFNERVGRIAFSLVFLGFNLAFFPLYIAGMLGMRRRVYTYSQDLGIGDLNAISTGGAYLLAAGFALILLNLVWHARRGRRAAGNPWNDGSLEWSTPSPPPSYGFARPPIVRDLYPLWKKEEPDMRESALREGYDDMTAVLDHRPAGWRATLLTDVTNAHPQRLQSLPGPTTFPFFTALVIAAAAIAVLAQSYGTALMAALVAAGMTGRWIAWEPMLPEDERGFLAKHLDLPLEGSGTKAVGWWGMVGTVAILLMVLGTLLFSYFYLRLYSPRWPPYGFEPPDFGMAFFAFCLLFAGGAVQGIGKWVLRRGKVGTLAAATTFMLGLGFVILEAYDLFFLPFAPTANAYGSIFFALKGFLLLIVATAAAFQAGILVRLLSGGEPLASPRLNLWIENGRLFWFFALCAVLLGFATLYGVPYIR